MQFLFSIDEWNVLFFFRILRLESMFHLEKNLVSFHCNSTLWIRTLPDSAFKISSQRRFDSLLLFQFFLCSFYLLIPCLNVFFFCSLIQSIQFLLRRKNRRCISIDGTIIIVRCSIVPFQPGAVGFF